MLYLSLHWFFPNNSIISSNQRTTMGIYFASEIAYKKAKREKLDLKEAASVLPWT
jgi:hypothetical protein